MTTPGTAIFFDGVTSARQTVTLQPGLTALRIRAPDGATIAEWLYADVAAFAAPEGVLRLGLAKSPVLARLEIRDPGLAAAVAAHAGPIRQVGAIDGRTRVKVVGWSFAAVVSALLVAVFGVPAIVTRVAPLIPVRVEQRLGVSVDFQVRALLDRGDHDRFECSGTPGPGGALASRAAFDKLVRTLEAGAALPLPLRVAVVRRPEANAIALPGGRVYVFEGLVDKAENADELAGVIAHEVGHIAHRDGVRAVIQAAGLSFLFGMLIGDFSGGGAAVLAMRTVLQSSYSRETEADADAYGAGLMRKLDRDPRALGNILMRIAGTPGPMAKILLSHPEARERAAAIAGPVRAVATASLADGTGGSGASAGPGLLSAAEWAALKRICKATPQAVRRDATPQAARRGAIPQAGPGEQ
jgi:Zn-dependent protease with chaperone function